MKKIVWIAVLCCMTLWLFAMPEREKFRRGPGMWEVFSQLDETERARLMKLQREDPEAFRQEMEKRAEKLYQEKLAKRAELQKLIDDYQAATDLPQKEKIKSQLTEKMKADFDQRLADHRRHLEKMKRHAAEFEKKLERRAAERDAIVEKLTNELLSGEKKLLEVRKMPLPPPPPPPPPENEKKLDDGFVKSI